MVITVIEQSVLCCATSLLSCPTLCDPMDCSLLGSSSMGFSRQEYWRGLLFPPLGDLPDPGVELASLNVSCVGRQVCILVSPGKSVHILRNGRLITSFFFFHFKRHFKRF